MPWPVYYIAAGWTFLPGAGLLALGGILGMLRQRKWMRYVSLIAVPMGIAMVIISAEALPVWLYVIWTASVLAWMFRGRLSGKKPKVAISIAMLGVTAAIAGLTISHQICPTLPAASYPRLYVIGDSVSAGLGDKGIKTWPTLIATEHGVRVVDLSVAGATITDAEKRLQTVQLADGIVLLEIGSNDMLGKGNPQQFEKNFETLARSVQGGGRTVVMFELPLFPFGNAYGLAQRRVASRYHILLIPRRCFAEILATPGATSDGLHLNQIGQDAMADLVWHVIGQAMSRQPVKEKD